MLEVMNDQQCIRCISIIAHVDHGKTTLTDSLVASAGMIRREAAGDALATETRKDERERGITIKSTGISLFCDVPRTGEPLLVNLIDSPGHVDFSSEVTAALRVTDGALVVVDCIEGVRVQTVAVLRQALAERVRPILVLNKLDRPFLELQHEPEDIYQSLCRTIESVNVIIATAIASSERPLPGSADWTVDPLRGTVVFAAAAQGWGFSLSSFAEKYAGKTKDVSKLASLLWGDNFYDDVTGVWRKTPTTGSSKRLERGFCRLVLRPLAQALALCRGSDMQALAGLAEAKLGARGLTALDLTAMDQKHRAKAVLQPWLPLDAALLDAVAEHLPSPAEAQRYRTELLYTGPADDPTATAMTSCDASGPTVVFISKMVPDEASHSSRFFAFGRVFSGTVVTGQRVDVIDGNTGDRASNKAVQRVMVAMGKTFQQAGRVPAGNTVALVGVDQFIAKSGTVVSSDSKSFPLRPMTFSVSAVVRAAVETASPADLPKLLEALRRLSKSDQLVQVLHTPAGEHVVAAAGELHLEVALHDLREFLADAGVPDPASCLRVSDPVVPFLETVASSTSTPLLAKSSNKLNRIFLSCQPLPSALVLALEQLHSAAATTSLTSLSSSLSSPQRLVSEQLKLTTSEARKIWSYAPTFASSESPAAATCLLVDSTKAVPYLSDVRENISSAFAAACREGPLLGEPLRGVRFDLTDALIHSDPRHRGAAQVGLATRRCVSAACLSAGPRIVEPVYMCEVSCQRHMVGSVYALLGRRRGRIHDEISLADNAVVVRAFLPVVESFGFNSQLRAETSGQASPQLTFSHWEVMDDDPLDPRSGAHKLARKVRKQKGMKEELPLLSDFCDKL